MQYRREKNDEKEILKNSDVHSVNSDMHSDKDSVNLAMSVVMKDIQEQSNTTTRIQCHEIKFSK